MAEAGRDREAIDPAVATGPDGCDERESAATATTRMAAVMSGGLPEATGGCGSVAGKPATAVDGSGSVAGGTATPGETAGHAVELLDALVAASRLLGDEYAPVNESDLLDAASRGACYATVSNCSSETSNACDRADS